ncbi:hypothetical protein PWT90_00989 [Aphanocladium album]|nr:hypothetical protein PWT90_00989 [Aphanocladium album]
MASTIPDETPTLAFTLHKYGDHDLQRFGVWQRVSQVEALSNSYWIVFLHGGAWYDPRNTFKDVLPCVEYMNSSSSPTLSSVLGFVSIDHRLSPHADHPQDPKSTKSCELRVAKHPDHLNDVHLALSLAQELYGIGKNYIFIGHCAGATMGCQLMMGRGAVPGYQPDRDIHLPSAIIGLYGIYDLVGLNTRYKGEYTTFLETAFGKDREVWQQLSPACFHGVIGAAHGRHVYYVLTDSPDDKLIDRAEAETMREKLVHDGVDVRVVGDLTGDHDHICRGASQLAQLAFDCLEVVKSRKI